SFFVVTATSAASPLSLHDALPILLDRDAPAVGQLLHRHVERALRQRQIALADDVLVGHRGSGGGVEGLVVLDPEGDRGEVPVQLDRKSTRLNSSHVKISYAVFCLK